ncbi:MAG: hypothetical protein ACXVCX_10925, partial [Ktedonobacterales bacterium]
PTLLYIPRAIPVTRGNVALPFVCHDRAVLPFVSRHPRPSPLEVGRPPPMASTPWLRNINLQRIIEPVEIIEQPNDRRQLDNLPLVEVFAQIRPDIFIHPARIRRHALGQGQRRAFDGREHILMLIDIVHRVEQLLGGS